MTNDGRHPPANLKIVNKRTGATSQGGFHSARGEPESNPMERRKSDLFGFCFWAMYVMQDLVSHDVDTRVGAVDHQFEPAL